MRVRNGIVYFGCVVLAAARVSADPLASLEVSPGLQELEMRFATPLGDPPDDFKHPDVSWSAAYPITLDYRVKTSQLEGWTSLFFCARKGGKYAIDADVIDWEAKTRTRKRWVITVVGPEPEPDPPDPPDPKPDRPEGVAGLVFDEAVKPKRPKDAAALATNYATSASMIAAGGIKSVPEANRDVSERNRALKLKIEHWGAFSDWVNEYSTANVQTLPKTLEFFEAMAEGLEAAGR